MHYILCEYYAFVYSRPFGTKHTRMHIYHVFMQFMQRTKCSTDIHTELLHRPNVWCQYETVRKLIFSAVTPRPNKSIYDPEHANAQKLDQLSLTKVIRNVFMGTNWKKNLRLCFMRLHQMMASFTDIQLDIKPIRFIGSRGRCIYSVHYRWVHVLHGKPCVCVYIYIYIHIYRYIYMYTLLSDFAVCTMLYARRPLGIYAISQGRNCRELYTIEQYSVDTPSLFEDELCFKLRWRAPRMTFPSYPLLLVCRSRWNGRL